MGRYKGILFVLGIVLSSPNPVSANLMWIDVDARFVTEGTFSNWAFDEVLQEVTIVQTI